MHEVAVTVQARRIGPTRADFTGSAVIADPDDREVVGFVCEWPAAGIPLVRQEIDAQILLDAAGRARELFAAEPTSHPAHTWSSGVVRVEAPR